MKKLKLTQGKYALVDNENYEFLSQWKWAYHKSKADKTGYAIRSGYDPKTGKRSRIAMHRVLLKAKKGQICDHINGNGVDNRISNLRICNKFESSWNKKTFSTKRLNAIKGVTIVKNHRGIPAYWIARITYKKKRIYLGTFETKELAEKAYINAAKKYHGEYAKW
jgi:hypothetical protein